MQEEQLFDLLEKVQKSKSETNTLEIKCAGSGAPKKIYDTLSSFSNQDSGGIILFGVDEKNNFKETGVYDPRDLIRKVSEQGEQMTPTVRPVITQVNKGKKSFVSAEIPAVPYHQRPCFYTGAGGSGALTFVQAIRIFI